MQARPQRNSVLQARFDHDSDDYQGILPGYTECVKCIPPIPPVADSVPHYFAVFGER